MMVAMVMVDHVPATMPMNMVIEKPNSGSPPNNHSDATEISVVPDVIRVRDSVFKIAWLFNSAIGNFTFALSSSRIRSEMMIESLSE